jgi:ribonucleoside-triphosphate reductase
LAGAIALSTLFLDITHLLIYKQRIPLDKVKNDKVTRKYLENRFQKLIHSVCHPTRDSIESPFTNVSVFDKEKLHNFIGPDNYQWYFPKNIKVLADNELGGENGKISREEFDDFIVEYITEVQKIFIDFFDKGDPSQNGMQYRFPVTTPNMTKKIDEMTGKYYLDKDNEMLNYITKKDIARYNLFTSLGTKIASCCRMINNKEMMDSLGSTVNSFGGSGGASLGSHRAITINFVRIAYEATSYEDYLRILKERIDDCAKILKAHKVLLYKLTDMGLEPFVNRGWIILERLFSTFGVNGLYESNIILKEKFGDVVDDYKKDILINFNNFYKEAAKRENIVANAEQTPVESMSPKLFKADNILFGNPYAFPQMYANQFVPTWVHTTIREKFTEEGKYDGYMDGGSIAHLQIGSDLTPSQAKEIIMQSVEAGCEHFALNAVYSRCKECGAVEKANWKECPHCHSEKVEHLSRVVGFFVVMDNINPVRRENDWKKRTFITKDELNTQLGK